MAVPERVDYDGLSCLKPKTYFFCAFMSHVCVSHRFEVAFSYPF